MNTRRFRQSAWPVDAPSLLVVLAALGLWLLWPEGNYRPSGWKPLPRPSAAYGRLGEHAGRAYVDPAVFVCSSWIGDAAGDDAFVPEPLLSRNPSPPRLLERAAGRRTVAVPLETALLARVPAVDGRYVPRWPRGAVPDALTAGWNVPLLQVSATLRERDFAVPEFAATVTGAERSWQVRVQIELSEGGQVQHVFVVQPDEDLELTRSVVKTLMRGRAAEGNEECAGWVIVSFEGRRPAPEDK